MATELVGPCPSEMKEGETYKVVKDGDKLVLRNAKEGMQKRHITTIAGQQAEAIIRAINKGSQDWIDRSVPGLAVLELWEDYDPKDEYWEASDD